MSSEQARECVTKLQQRAAAGEDVAEPLQRVRAVILAELQRRFVAEGLRARASLRQRRTAAARVQRLRA